MAYIKGKFKKAIFKGENGYIIGLFKVNDKYVIRRLLYKNDTFILRADNKDFKDITINSRNQFQIIGRVYI